MALRAALLDIDGTLLDSNDAHADAWVEVLREHEVEADRAQIRSWIGMGGDQILARLGLSDETEPGQTISAERKQRFRARWLPRLRPFDGARDLLTRLADRGLARVAVTSASKEEVDGLLTRAGVRDLVTDVITADDADRSKPAPDVIEAALGKLGIGMDEAVMLGDTPYDLEAANRAGVPMVAVRCGGWSFDDGGPVAVYEGPRELVEQFERSPFSG